MKRAILAVLTAIFLVGCGNSEREEALQRQLGESQSEQGTLRQSVADRDKYMEEVIRSINEVYVDLEQARAKETKLAMRVDTTEAPMQFSNAEVRQNFLKKIDGIGTTLKANRKRITDLQVRVRSLGGEVKSLNTLIANLKQSLKEREESIAQLEGRVQGLEQMVAEKTRVISEQDSVIVTHRRTESTGYMIVGTRRELREKGIIKEEGGFLWGLLGSTTVLASDIDKTLFTPIDKTREKSVSVKGVIEEVLPHRNENLFSTAEPVEETSVLTVVQPDRFWQDNYLVIIVD
jgi:peptidoglycan hydrolase CwlO-like protein